MTVNVYRGVDWINAHPMHAHTAQITGRENNVQARLHDKNSNLKPVNVVQDGPKDEFVYIYYNLILPSPALVLCSLVTAMYVHTYISLHLPSVI